ncbi:MAG: hypothetical protein WCA56_08650 [Xanthobacteraceae bacterium]
MKIAGADLHQSEIGIEPRNRVVVFEGMTVVAQIAEQGGLAMKDATRGEERRARQQYAETAQKLRLRLRDAEVANKQPLAGHLLSEGLQANQERVEKRRVAAGYV